MCNSKFNEILDSDGPLVLISLTAMSWLFFGIFCHAAQTWQSHDQVVRCTISGIISQDTLQETNTHDVH